MFFESLLRGIIGIALIFGICYLFSNNRKAVNWRLVFSGLGLQAIFAILIIKGELLRSFFFPLGWPKDFFNFISSFFVVVLDFTREGALFVFGNLALSPGIENSLGFFFAFQVLPTIIFFASLMSILYYLGIMQWIVKGMAWVMAKIMGTSGAESLSCTANIFVGQTEAPLMIKPFLSKLTNSELLTIMTGGMATIAGGVMAAYIQILGDSLAKAQGIPLQQAQLEFATHLLGASVLAAPAAMMLSKIVFPETETPVTKGTVTVAVEKNGSNVVEAAASGASDGLQLALNVGGMLIAFIALIFMVNTMLEWFGAWVGVNEYLRQNFGQPLNLQLIFGMVLQWLAMGVGVPAEDALRFGGLIGTKIVLNEFVAYSELGSLMQAKAFVHEKSAIMLTYALCGFANFSSIAIQLGGLGVLAPERRSDLAKLGMRAVLCGSLATLLTATIAGILY